MEQLKKLLTSDEAIYKISRCGGLPVYIVGPIVTDVDRQLDISGCIEDTLHRMLDAELSDADIFEVLHASKCDDTYDESVDYYIDMDYIIYSFLPIAVTDIGVHYERPVSVYTVHYWDKVLCKHLVLPDDTTDDEVLESLSNVLGINPDDYIVNDIREDGTMFGVQSIMDDSKLLVLMKNKV